MQTYIYRYLRNQTYEDTLCIHISVYICTYIYMHVYVCKHKSKCINETYAHIPTYIDTNIYTFVYIVCIMRILHAVWAVPTTTYTISACIRYTGSSFLTLQHCTIQQMTSHYIALSYATSRYAVLLYATLQYITFHRFTLDYMHAYIALPCIS